MSVCGRLENLLAPWLRFFAVLRLNVACMFVKSTCFMIAPEFCLHVCVFSMLLRVLACVCFFSRVASDQSSKFNLLFRVWTWPMERVELLMVLHRCAQFWLSELVGMSLQAELMQMVA